MEVLCVGVGALIAGGIIGIIIGGVKAELNWYRRIRLKSDPRYRTADYVDGVFYYYIPESEFVRDYVHRGTISHLSERAG